MITSLQLENYRGFRRYRVEGLKRVNLLVGDNNCGKTSVLEAVHLLASPRPIHAMYSAAVRRGEAQQGKEGWFNASHFFHGHDIFDGASFTLSAEPAPGALTACVMDAFAAEGAGVLSGQGSGVGSGSGSGWGSTVAETPTTTLPPPELVLRATRHAGYTDGPTWEAPLQDDGAACALGVRHDRAKERKPGPPVTFVAAASVLPEGLRQMWDEVIIGKQENEAVDALRLLAPEVKDIRFLTASGGGSPNGGIMVDMGNTRGRIPLGSLGDGMRRMLALSVSLIQSDGGALLLDEIDTGLHYSVMGDMWKLVTEAARKHNSQVFATTHSYDCVKGLAWLCEHHPELAGETSVHKIVLDLEEAVSFGPDSIVRAVKHGTELR